MMSYVRDTTAIVSTTLDGSDGGKKVPFGATTVSDSDNATSRAVDTAASSSKDKKKSVSAAAARDSKK